MIQPAACVTEAASTHAAATIARPIATPPEHFPIRWARRSYRRGPENVPVVVLDPVIPIRRFTARRDADNHAAIKVKRV
jgi:hypothetical protein